MTTHSYPVLPLPPCPLGGPSPAEVRTAIAGWLASPALADLVRAFGGEPPSGPPETVIDELARFSRYAWDARGGGERDDTRWPAHAAEVDALVRASAHALGLAGRQRPAGGSYDHVLVLGGGPRTAMARTHFTTGLLDERAIRTAAIAGLGSLRPLSPRERATAAEWAMPELVCEADAMAAAFSRVFDRPRRESQRTGVTDAGEQWWVRTYELSDRTLHVIAAPASRPGERANTVDTLTGWAELVASPTSRERLLLVTTDLFVPFQHCDAVRTLGLRYGCGVETVGFDAARDAWVTPRAAAAVLQEVRSAILSMQRLLRAFPGRAAGP
jgi:hypothetical protein